MQKYVNSSNLETSSEVGNKDLEIPSSDLNICQDQDNWWEMNPVHDVTMSDITRAVNVFITDPGSSALGRLVLKKEPEDVLEGLICKLNTNNKETVCNNASGSGSPSMNTCTNDHMEEDVVFIEEIAFPKEVDLTHALDRRHLQPVTRTGRVVVPKDTAFPTASNASNTFANRDLQTNAYLRDDGVVWGRDTSLLPSIDASLYRRSTLRSKTGGSVTGNNNTQYLGSKEINKIKLSTILTDIDDCSVSKSSVHPDNARSEDCAEHVVTPQVPNVPQQFQCSICDNVYTVLRTFVSHMKSHSVNSKTKVCNENSLAKHSTKVIDPSQPAMSSISVVKHTVSHKRKKEHFPCPIADECNLKFPSKRQLDKHVKINHKSDGYMCKKCGKRYLRLNLLEQHENVHKGVKPYKCEKCGKTFHTNVQKHGHFRIHHVVPDTELQCEICGVVGTATFMYVHKRRVHLKKRYPCEECKAIFRKAGKLKDHMRMHRGEDQYKCDLCSHSFVQKKNLVGHLRRHVKRYPCPKCDKVFTSQRFLQGHLLLHDGIKKYCCNVCGKTFTHSHYLFTHKKSHGEKLFKCAICGGKFNRKDNLKSHIIRHMKK